MSDKDKPTQNDVMDSTLSGYKVKEPKQPTPQKPTTPVTPTPDAQTPVQEPAQAPAPEAPVKDSEDELLDWLSQREQKAEEVPASGEPAPPADPEEPRVPETEEFSLDLDNDRFEEVTSNPEELAKYAKGIYDKAITDMRGELAQIKEEFQQQLASAKEEVLQNIPQLVSKSAERTQATRSLVSNFYGTYPDLKDRREYVRDMITTVSGRNPDWDAQKVLDEVAARAKRDFGIHEKAQEREKERKSDPKFAGAGGRRTPSGQVDNRTNQQKLLDDTFL